MVKMEQKVIWGPRLPGAIAGLWLMWHGQAYYREPWLNGRGEQVFASFELQGQGLMMIGLGWGIIALVVACTTRLVPVDSGEEQAQQARGVEGSYNEGGLREGVWTWRFANGQKKTEGIYKDGKAEGLAASYYRKGQKRSEGTNKDGKKEGVWTYWDVKGNVTKTETYKNGELVK